MSIRSLARQLDLSIGTVSRALNDRPDVNEATRARVKAAAAAIGYEPNQSGRSLRKGCTDMVAAVVTTSSFAPQTESVIGRVFEGTRRTLHAEGVDLIVLFRGPQEDPLASLQRIVTRRIADAIILTQTRRDDPRVPYLQASGMGFVAFGRSETGADAPWVDLDFEAAAVTAVRHFLAGGHRRIALVLSEHDLNYNDILRRSFRAEAARHGLGPEAALLIESRANRLCPDDRAALARREAPTAFLVGAENIAAGLYADLAAAGRPVGDKAAVVSALPALNPDALSPGLSSFDADMDGLGCALGRHLLAILPGVEPRAAPASAVAPGRLVLRGSAPASVAVA